MLVRFQWKNSLHGKPHNSAVLRDVFFRQSQTNITFFFSLTIPLSKSYGLRQANLVLIAYASSEGSGEPAHPRSLARTFAARSYKQ